MNQDKQTPVFDWAQNFIQKIDFKPGSKVLDIGCREGLISGYLAEQFNQLSFVSMDKNMDAVEIAKEDHIHSNLSFACENPELFCSTEQYDAVVSFSCLHWVNNQLGVLKNIYRALKPGGKAYLQFFASHGRAKNDQFLYQTAGLKKWKSYFGKFKPQYLEITPGELSTLLNAAGFIIHRFEFQRYKSYFGHLEHFQAWLRTWATHKDRVPQQKQDHFLLDTAKAYLNAHHYPLNDKFPYYEYVLEVTCEKPDFTTVIEEEASRRYNDIVFTPRELLVLKHYLQGKSSKEISRVASISAKTIEFHIANIKDKLGCHKRSDIYRAAFNDGFIHLMFHDHETFHS